VEKVIPMGKLDVSVHFLIQKVCRQFLNDKIMLKFKKESIQLLNQSPDQHTYIEWAGVVHVGMMFKQPIKETEYRIVLRVSQGFASIDSDIV